MREIPVGDSSAAAAARRAVADVAQALAFDTVLAGRAALVATELATNLVKHAGRGSLLVGDAGGALHLVAIDRGPGIADLSRSIADGYSTAGTAGNGLGAVRRLSQAFHVASWPGRGTAVYARLEAKATPKADAIAAVEIAKAGETTSGDAWSASETAAGRTVLVVDGLGHGTDAAIAALEAIRQFERSPHESPVDIVQGVHLAIRHTRGAAVAAAHIAYDSRTVVYCGIGNIAGSVLAPDGTLRRMVSLNGTAGHNARKVQAFEYPYGRGPLVMHSDGIATNWTMDAYPGLAFAHPMLVAAVLYRDHARGRDDATVVVASTEAGA